MRSDCESLPQWGRRLAALTAVLAATAASPALTPPDVTEYARMCNASAAVSVGNGLFVVADDEDKDPTPLRLYRVGQAGKFLSEAAVPDDVLGLDPQANLEVDVEGAARIGDVVFWIGSHSASKDGDPRPNRRRLFATKLIVDNDQLTIGRVGKPYKDLIGDLDKDSRYARFGLPKAAEKEPKATGALSIEGLAATPDGGLLIGFRNPITGGKALAVQLKNPTAVLEGKPAEFGPPIELDLGGLGVRSMEQAGGGYLIVAGRHDNGHDSRLFRWSGEPGQNPKAVPGIDLSDLNPEALFFDATGAYLLSDDGKRETGGTACEDLPRKQRQFRGFRAPTPP